MLGIFLDIETTGLDPTRHRAIEIALQVHDTDTGMLVATYESIIAQSPQVWQESDPASLNVNGFTWERCCEGKPEAVVSQEITALFQKLKITRGEAVFIGQNSSFDRAFFAQLVPVYKQEELQWPYHWLDLASMYWAIQLKTGRGLTEKSLSKNAIAAAYHLPPEESPHRALQGVRHLIACYNALLRR